MNIIKISILFDLVTDTLSRLIEDKVKERKYDTYMVNSASVPHLFLTSCMLNADGILLFSKIILQEVF